MSVVFFCQKKEKRCISHSKENYNIIMKCNLLAMIGPISDYSWNLPVIVLAAHICKANLEENGVCIKERSEI